MKAVQVLAHGRPGEVVRVSDVAVPDPGPGEVRIAVSAASLNFGDGPRALGGVAMAMLKPPFTLGMDVCGTVEAAGAGGEAWLGRRVVAMTKMALGGMAQKAIAPVTGLFEAPPELDDAQAATSNASLSMCMCAASARGNVDNRAPAGAPCEVILEHAGDLLHADAARNHGVDSALRDQFAQRRVDPGTGLGREEVHAHAAHGADGHAIREHDAEHGEVADGHLA